MERRHGRVENIQEDEYNNVYRFSVQVAKGLFTSTTVLCDLPTTAADIMLLMSVKCFELLPALVPCLEQNNT